MDHYSAARHALSILDPGGTWAVRLQELKTTDIRPPTRDIDRVLMGKCAHNVSSTTRTGREESEGRHALSWIWLVVWPTGTEFDGGKKVQAEIDESMSQDCMH